MIGAWILITMCFSSLVLFLLCDNVKIRIIAAVIFILSFVGVYYLSCEDIRKDDRVFYERAEERNDR